MKTEMASFDCLALARELQDITESRLYKAFQVSPMELKVQLNVQGRGKTNLVIEAGRRVHLTDYPKPSPTMPSTFAMTIRKHLANAFLKGVVQHAFERIIEFTFEKEGNTFTLVAELFGGGNVLLLDQERTIRAVLRPKRYKDRDLLGRRTYEYPPSRKNPFEISPGEMVDDIKKSDLVRTLAVTYGFGGLYAEEICSRAGVDKKTKELSLKDAANLIKTIGEMRDGLGSEKGQVIYKDETPIDATPVAIGAYAELETKEFDTFNQALDEYYTHFEVGQVQKEADDRFAKELGKYLARLRDQARVLKRYTIQKQKRRRQGDLIYAHFQAIENILAVLEDARKKHSWVQIQEILRDAKDQVPNAALIRQIIPGEGAVILDLDGEKVRIDITKTVTQNADANYSLAKKAKRKIPKTLEAVRRTAGDVKKIRARGAAAVKEEMMPKKKEKRELAWYEKFRWFTSSDGILVLGGRDATSNEVLVKKHMGSGDRFIHGQIHGAPAVVIKADGKDVPDTTIQETFDFAASFSSAWKHGVAALEVYWVDPDQVSKTTESGEYVSKGAFIIRGKRNMGTGTVKAAVGVQFEEKGIRIISGPPPAIEKTARYSVSIEPGRKKSKGIAEEIKAAWLSQATEDDKEEIIHININDIQIMLPSGGSDILRRK